MLFVSGDDIKPAAIDGATDPLAAWAKIREAAFAPAEAIPSNCAPLPRQILLCWSPPTASCVRRWVETDVPL
jgi:hypothetical protein